MKRILLCLLLSLSYMTSITLAQNSPFSVNNQSGQSVLNLTSTIGYGALFKLQRMFSTTNYYAFETGAGSNEDLRLYVNGNWAVPIMSYKTNGDVGIGTPSPDAKLAVKGTIHSQEVKVDMQGSMVPDYVFEPSYTLPSLDSVQTYINQNKHLPEVPSAKEMEANGVNLGEMNMLLLKKVEELTLYMLEQQKQIQFQQTEITQMKQQLKIIKPAN